MLALTKASHPEKSFCQIDILLSSFAAQRTLWDGESYEQEIAAALAAEIQSWPDVAALHGAMKKFMGQEKSEEQCALILRRLWQAWSWVAVAPAAALPHVSELSELSKLILGNDTGFHSAHPPKVALDKGLRSLESYISSKKVLEEVLRLYRKSPMDF